MSKSYTPGLKILESTKIIKERKLPLKGTISFKIGDVVRNDDIVASTFLPGNVHMVNISNQLNIEPETIKDYLVATIDQEVEKDSIIAENKGFFGLFKTQVKAPLKGKISNISKTTGQIMISEPDIPIEIDAYLDGEIIDVVKDEGVVIQCQGSLVQGIIGVGGEKKGEIVLDDSNDVDIKEKIVVIKGSIDKSLYEAYSKRGAIGIIAGGFDYQSLSEILGYKLGVAITGTEKIPTTLIITEGFGDVEMSEKTYEILQNHQGNRASINGATQIRAGVIRPEVVVVLDKKVNNNDNFNEDDLIIKEGSKVRVIRQPYFGQIGLIKSLPSDPVEIESETRARVAEIEFENNERKLVPRANLEIILE